MKKIIVFALLGFVGCINIDNDAVFTLEGVAKDSQGRQTIVNPDDGYQVCLKVSYEVLKKGINQNAFSRTDCRSFATDQNGTFKLAKQITLSGEGDQIQIKNARLFVRRYDQGSNSYDRFPATIEAVTLNESGGDVKATVTVW